MEDQPDNDLLADTIADVAFDVLERIGNNAEARYQFFKRFVELAKETVALNDTAMIRVDHPRKTQ